MDIKLRPQDIVRLNAFDNNRCRKCWNIFKEGDMVVRIGARPSKYFHKECFKQY